MLGNSPAQRPVLRISITERHVVLWRGSGINSWPVNRLNRLMFSVVCCPRVTWRRKGGTSLLLHSFLTSALSGGEKLASRPCRFAVGKEPWYPLSRRLDGLQSQSESLREEKNVFALPRFKPRTVRPTAWTTSASFYISIHYSLVYPTIWHHISLI